MIRTILFAFLISAAVATEFKTCKSGPKPIALRVIGCEKLPCDVVKGSEVELEVDFLSGDNDAEKVLSKVKATALGITVPYPLPGDLSEVCKHLKDDQACPLDAGEAATYVFKLPIGNYPEINVAVEVNLKNQDDETLACFIADIKVKGK